MESVIIDVDTFETTDVVKERKCVTFRTNVKCKEDFQRWKELFCQQNEVCFNNYRMYSVGQRKLYRETLICHHGVKHKGVKKTSTGCRVFIDVTIKIVHARSSDQIRDFPCFMKIWGNHNHPLDTADVLNQLRVFHCTREMFESYFRQEFLIWCGETCTSSFSTGAKVTKNGMTPGQAYRHHLLKMDLSYDLPSQAKKSTNPSPKSIEYMWNAWRQSEHGGLNTPSMFSAIRKYAEDNPELILKINDEDDQFCVVLVTPFMMRAHRQLKEAQEVVFTDATGCVDQLNTAVTPFLCAGPAGAVPLALVFTSSQVIATLTKGFGMVKEAVGDCAFYGKGVPQYFMTDNSDAERKALAVTWPTSQQFLCIFHILQQVWRWLLDSKHGINKNDRQELMAVVKSLVYAESRENFDELLEKIQINPTAEKYSNFKCYLTTLVQRREEWAIAFRAGALLRGHHTNNYCEATMCFIKDNVLNRCKAYNTAQLVMFMAEIFDCYMRQRLVDVALSRRRIRGVIMDSLPLETVEPLGGGMYQVQSESDTKVMYKVDLNIGMCTCFKGNNGAICKHQVTCAKHQMTVVPQLLLLNSSSRRQLAVLALGEENVPMESFFKSLKEVQNDKAVEENSDVDFVENSPHDNCMDSQMEMETPDVMLTDEQSETEAIITESHEAAEALVKMSTKYGNADTRSGLAKFIRRVTSIKTTNQLNTFLNTMGSSVKKGAGRGKIPCQPTSIARRSPGMPRGAATVGKGRRPCTAVTSRPKRPHNLAHNIQNNVANAKSHGSGH